MDATANVDSKILRHVLEGDVRTAGTELVLGFADEVYALCSSMVRDRTVAEDLSQDVFSRAFTALPAFRGEASVRTWILRIARNRCIDHLRARSRQPTIEDEPDSHPTDEPSVSDLIMRRQDLNAGLEALDESERALVVLRFGHELGYPELADAFGIKEGTARMRVSRAVAKMRDAIAAPQAAELAFESPPSPAAPPALPAPAAPPARRAPAPAAPRAMPPSPPSFGHGGGPMGGAPPPGASGARRRRGGATPSAVTAFARPASGTLRARLMDLAGVL